MYDTWNPNLCTWQPCISCMRSMGVALDGNRDILMSMPTITHLYVYVYIYIYYKLWLLYIQTAKKCVACMSSSSSLAISMQKDAVLATAHVYQKHSDCTKVQIGSNWYRSLYTHDPCFLSTTRTSPNLQETPTQKWRPVSPVSSRTCSKVAFLASASCHHASDTDALVSSPIAIHGPNS